MKKVIIDKRAPESVKLSLIDMGFSLIQMPHSPALPAPVASHPDMLLFIAGRQVFCHADYREIAKAEFEEIAYEGYDILTTDEHIGDKYPLDILFNALHMDTHIYGKADSLSALIREYAKASDITLRAVKQGYAKCSVAKVGERAAITSDTTLYKAMSADGYDVLLISAGGIGISEYDTGFIGGCSGYDGERVYFSGNIELHPDGAAITEFCKRHGMNAVSLSNEPLFDVGSLFFL